jgi:hypothetical protein
MTRPATVTKEGVLALLSRHSGEGMTTAEIGRAFGVRTESAGNMVRFLVSTGELVVSKKVNATMYYAKPAKFVSIGDAIVPAFKTNIWTKPLTGYTERMQAAAARALATRRP